MRAGRKNSKGELFPHATQISWSEHTVRERTHQTKNILKFLLINLFVTDSQGKFLLLSCHQNIHIYSRTRTHSESTYLIGASLKAVFGPRPAQKNKRDHIEKRVLDEIAEIWESRQASKQSHRLILGPSVAEVKFKKPQT